MTFPVDRTRLTAVAVAALAVLSVFVWLSTTPDTVAGRPSAAGAALHLHVSGNKLVDSKGRTVILHGVDRSGTEYQCVKGHGIFDGPNNQASISAMKRWGPVNAVRVPLNEACWNGESYVKSKYAGANYRNAVTSYVHLLNANGLAAILDLHWTDGTYSGGTSSCGSKAMCQKPMPDAAQAVPFWASVARTFKSNDSVVFDLFNEPSASTVQAPGASADGWNCWKNGGRCPGIPYQVAGMQRLVNTVRSTGANNVLMLGGLKLSNDLSKWKQNEPNDPDHNLAASWHSYPNEGCATASCWDTQVGSVIPSVPLIAGEIGEFDCQGSYISPLTTWLESQNASFLAWSWDASGKCYEPQLITKYDGTPTSSFGSTYKAILEALPKASAGRHLAGPLPGR